MLSKDIMVNERLFDILTFLITKAWGHLLIPTLLGTIFWAIVGFWYSWEFFYWIIWIGAFLAIGWFLTIMSWAKYYWDIYRPD